MGDCKTVGIIGGGAAGLFAGSFLRDAGVPFKIYERGPKVGRKLLLTGHGRCNITNHKLPSELKAGYYEAGNFIYPSLKSFSSDDAIDYIENVLRVPLKEEENNRMFPVTDSSATVVDALVDHIGTDNIITCFCCTEIRPSEDGFELISDDGRVEKVSRVILACGGRTYPQTGSDGIGYRLAESLGHTITPLVPSICAIDVCGEDREFTAQVSGISVNAGASLFYDDRKQAHRTGDVLFTHKGISGPAIHGLSREIPRDIASRDGWIELDFTPGRSEEETDRDLIRMAEEHPDMKLSTIGSDIVPSSLAKALAKRAGVTDLYAKNCDRKARKAYLKQLKHLELGIKEPPVYETAYVTRGGVALKELKRKTLESELVPGVYIIGELADIDGVSGGYNLQAAMSEAFVAVRDILS